MKYSEFHLLKDDYELLRFELFVMERNWSIFKPSRRLEPYNEPPLRWLKNQEIVLRVIREEFEEQNIEASEPELYDQLVSFHESMKKLAKPLRSSYLKLEEIVMSFPRGHHYEKGPTMVLENLAMGLCTLQRAVEMIQENLAQYRGSPEKLELQDELELVLILHKMEA